MRLLLRKIVIDGNRSAWPRLFSVKSKDKMGEKLHFVRDETIADLNSKGFTQKQAETFYNLSLDLSKETLAISREVLATKHDFQHLRTELQILEKADFSMLKSDLQLVEAKFEKHVAQSRQHRAGMEVRMRNWVLGGLASSIILIVMFFYLTKKSDNTQKKKN